MTKNSQGKIFSTQFSAQPNQHKSQRNIYSDLQGLKMFFPSNFSKEPTKGYLHQGERKTNDAKKQGI